jgi:hypothetical protein
MKIPTPEQIAKWRAEFEAYCNAQPEADAEPERIYEFDEDGINQLTKDVLQEGYLAACQKRQEEIDKLREALEQLACLGNGDKWGNSHGNTIAQQALKATK